MFKKLILISTLTSMLLAANGPKKVNEYFEYDAANGWWWYKEKYQDKDKEFETKVKVTPKEKMKMDKEQEKIKLMKEQVKRLSKIQERLEYAYPNITPIYTKNKKTGKKCLTNSSVDCFVFPLQAEAQHVPVMAKWLSDPNPENSKEWLKWQAKYFNHLTDIGYGNKFAYLSGGDKVYATDNFYADGDNLNFPVASKMRTNRETQIISSLKDKLTIMFFLGKTPVMDFAVRADRAFYNWNKRFYKDWNFYFVFEDQNKLKKYEEKILSSGIQSNIKAWKEQKEKGHIVVKPQYFKKFKIDITPTTVVLYTKDKKKGDKAKNVIWQKISTGHILTSNTLKNVVQFLIYNKIIDPAEMSSNKMNETLHKVVNTKPEIKEDKIYEENKILVGGKK